MGCSTKPVPGGAERRAAGWREAALASGLALALALGSGCERASRGARIASRAVSRFFATPRAIPHRIEEPRRPEARLAVLWVGHATALIQIEDKFVLTDPVFTDTVGQLSKRSVEPGILPEHLPQIDAVLVSHMHFDHFSLGSLDMIEEKVERLVVPRGSLPYVPRYDFPVTELSTWESTEVDGLSITATPVDHLGWRYGADADWMHATFTGYVVAYRGVRVYFGGDTAYRKHDFEATRRRLGPFDVALLPIAPISPRPFMRTVHMDPLEALAAVDDLGARTMIPIHYETFIDSLDEPGTPRAVLRAGLAADRARGGDLAGRVFDLPIGGQKVILRKEGAR